jgi:hypothetical protein
MSKNDERLDAQAPQPSAKNRQHGEADVVEGERIEVEKKRASTQGTKANAIPAPTLDLTLNDLPLLETNRKFKLDELVPYEIRDRNMKVINDYVARRASSEPPNIIAVDVGEVKPVIVDGVTRYISAAIANAETITADVYRGTWEHVKILALRLNQHGEKLQAADIKSQIDKFDELYKDNPLSSREMAKLVGTSHSTVAAHRAARGQSVLEGIKNLRRGKTPEEKRAALVKNTLRMIEEQGDEVLGDIVAALPGALRSALIKGLVARYSTGG